MKSLTQCSQAISTHLVEAFKQECSGGDTANLDSKYFSRQEISKINELLEAMQSVQVIVFLIFPDF